MTELEKQGQAAQKASKILALASSEQKNQALDRMAAELLAHQKEWLEANRQDVEAAGKAGMNSSFSDRLTLTEDCDRLRFLPTPWVRPTGRFCVPTDCVFNGNGCL